MRSRKETYRKKNPLSSLVIWLAVALYAFLLYRTAWITEDAYITYRTIDNFVNGYGLTWNTDERVQAYTHPLWMFLLSGLYAVFGNMYWTSILFSMAVSLAVIALLSSRIASSVQTAVLGVLMLTFSKAFMDYSTSGLENPLTHLLLVLFCALYLRRQPDGRHFFMLALLAALAMVNRMDSILLFAPVLAWVFFDTKSWRAGWLARVGIAVLGFLPFILWELFSLFYYGVPVPNTGYAKLNTGIDAWAYARQGFFYLKNSLFYDPVTLPAIVIGSLVPLLARDWKRTPIAAGAILYILYVIKVGGDFMSGRFMTAPLLAATIALISMPLVLSRKMLSGTAIALLVLSLLAPYPSLLSDASYGTVRKGLIDEHGIADERAFYYQAAGLLRAHEGVTLPDSPMVKKGLEWQNRTLSLESHIGFFGFYGGPGLHIVDSFALSEPLLARLPISEYPKWRIGHYTRIMPEGYPDTIASGENRIKDPNLAAYYDKLSFIIKGPLFDMNRIKEIWKLNTGQYDRLIAAYKPPERLKLNLADVQKPTVLPPTGADILLGAETRAAQLSIELSNNDDYYVVFLKGMIEVGSSMTSAKEGPVNGLKPHAVEVPKQAAAEGYNRIIILPRLLDGHSDLHYAVGPLHFQLPGK
ncbi:glycosyltransferase family 39 protein [Aneurinibacillus sp. BA2021]|nr:glycosyltransferase family 39 protein [Aneurinibacillus sp. BA2021]